MMNNTPFSRQAVRPLRYIVICVLFMTLMGCSGSKKPEQPFIIPFDSKYVSSDKTLSVSPALDTDGSSSRDFLSITQETYLFENGNATAKVQLFLNRKAKPTVPAIGEWSTVSTGNCMSNSTDVNCFTAHIDCHLIRTTYIDTGKRSLTVIKVRNRAREPQELCEKWNLKNLSPDQEAMVEDFNSISDSYFSYQ